MSKVEILTNKVKYDYSHLCHSPAVLLLVLSDSVINLLTVPRHMLFPYQGIWISAVVVSKSRKHILNLVNVAPKKEKKGSWGQKTETLKLVLALQFSSLRVKILFLGLNIM